MLTQYKAHSLIRHLQRGWGFLHAELGEFVEILPASQRVHEAWYQGTADALYQNIDILRTYQPSYVLVLAGDHVYKMDYGPMLASHFEHKADLTIACMEVPLGEASAFGIMSVNEHDRVMRFQEKPQNPDPIPGRSDLALVSMGIYVFNTDFLYEQLIKDADTTESSHDFGKDLIPSVIDRCAVYVYPFRHIDGETEAYWRDVGTVDAYYDANMELISITPKLNLYDTHWPIWTYQEQLPPAKFVFNEEQRRGMAVESTVSGGCIISGAYVCRSLLFSTVDAVSGKVWTRFDWIASDQYRVYRLPAESPSHTTPLPPADGRTLMNGPANADASRFGWHDSNGAVGAEFTTTQGNNVHAYTDVNADNSPDGGSSPSGGTGLRFDFPLNLNQEPSAYRSAAVTNLFYWNNIIHDVQYRYGFDEEAGNFQLNNYGKRGLENDAVRAEAQDGSGTNNANFFTPPDGSSPRMQMFLWSAPNPDRDGDFDNGIIIHEYGHGISNRLVGGPSNANCLTNGQQPGEGLSDWWSLVYTAKPGDKGTDARGIGTYALGQPPNGAGIRTRPYSTDPAVNNWTYASINGMRIPHGVGSVWAQAAWEVYWTLVDHWGFDPDLYNAQGNAGNQRMMLYVNEGLKNTACNPTFTQVRDGIIDGAKQLHGGEDVCRLWSAFAAFGLGTDAVSGGADSTSPSNGFLVPASCPVSVVPIVPIVPIIYLLEN